VRIEFAVQANLPPGKLSVSGRSYKRDAEKEKDWKREQQRLMRHKA
jgi:tmRNA-binding protein